MKKMKIGSFEGAEVKSVPVARFPNEVYFSSQVDEETITSLLITLSEVDASLLEYENLLDIDPYTVPIALFFSTPGGSVDDALRFISFIRMMERDVFVVADSLVASSGVYMYLSVPKTNRISTKFAYFMIHDVRIVMPEFTNIKDAMANTQQLYEKLREILEKELLKEVRIADKFSWEKGKTISADVYLSLNEAIDRNFVSKSVNNKEDLYKYIYETTNFDLNKFKKDLMLKLSEDKDE